ncbi:hypothetical protein Pmani_026290 [Petrolisthes manimaculis]|uniref:Uncharacterized protein n=1 Tax=Petrolisthes manimaculis TaxID=1843537 RepID=A0AAE1P640_9EUCA|nr:hypothetical protein Pmani_026290 [Petrolisthes manimaculis]
MESSVSSANFGTMLDAEIKQTTGKSHNTNTNTEDRAQMKPEAELKDLNQHKQDKEFGKRKNLEIYRSSKENPVWKPTSRTGAE